MGATESTEAGLEFFWDSTTYDYGAAAYGEEENYSSQSKGEEDTEEEKSPPAERAITTLEAGGEEGFKDDEEGTGEEDEDDDGRMAAEHTSADAKEEITTAAAVDASATAPATPPRVELDAPSEPSELGGEAVRVAVDLSKVSTEARMTREAAEKTARHEDSVNGAGVRQRTKHGRARDFPFAVLFVLHVLLVSSGIAYSGVLYLKSHASRRKAQHHMERWLPQLGAAVVVGSSFAATSQTLFRLFPRFMARSTAWISALLTLAVSLMLASASSAANLGVGILCLIFSLCQSLYACWVSSRIMYASDLLHHSLNSAKKVSGPYLTSFGVLILGSVWVMLWSFALVSALSFQIAPLVVLVLLASLAWTLEALKNVVCTISASAVSLEYRSQPSSPQKFKATISSWFGSICLGSLIAPTLHGLRVVARGLNRINGDHEFMFSCAGCFAAVMDVLARHANNWAYAEIAIHDKSFIQASEDAYELFKYTRLSMVIDKDLTTSFCALTGISGGMLCALVSGGWTFGTHKTLTLSLSIVAFLIGYLMVRIMMGVLQGAIYAHYVCYAENPTSQGLIASPISERLVELTHHLDIESGRKPFLP